MEAFMAVQDYEYRERNAFDDARRAEVDLDRGTILAAAILGAALLLFFAYMLIASPTV
jgi:hypothetical protein